MSIEVTGLCHSYKKDTPFENKVLFNLSLTIDDGEFVGLIGPTQAGKTTLAQHFNALFIPQKGRVIVNGCDTKDKKADLVTLRHQVGYVFQNPDYQLFAPTVGEDIAFGPKNQRLSPGEVENRVKNALKQVGLDYDTFYHRDVYALSGGQKRRVAIAGVLACRPRILILDDITAGLDPRGREDILAVIRSLHRKEQITIIFISNSMNEVAELAERIIILDKGRIYADGTTRDIFTRSEELHEIGLELPEIMIVANRLREEGFKLPPAILNLDEAISSITRVMHERQVTD
jgi:energy-coupling factor transport system ATP-binding protein